MSSPLPVNLVDGGEVEVIFLFGDKRVEMTAFDNKTLGYYQFNFAKCTNISIDYSDIEEDWTGLSDLNDGIMEIEDKGEGSRSFIIHFSDESVLQVSCQDFSVEPLPKLYEQRRDRREGCYRHNGWGSGPAGNGQGGDRGSA